LLLLGVLVPKQIPTLDQLATSLACAAVAVQLELDLGHARDREQFARALAHVPAGDRPSLTSLGPTPLELSQFDVSCRIRIVECRTVGFTMIVQPLNLSYDRRYRVTETVDSSIAISVVRVPLSPLPHGEAAVIFEGV
jgi:hypothetical protein